MLLLLIKTTIRNSEDLNIQTEVCNKRSVTADEIASAGESIGELS